jgi:virginiamycin B lyase
VNPRKKGIIFFAVVAGIMLSSGVTIAINPAQWFGDSSDFDQITPEELNAFDLDSLGLELGYNYDESLQFCSTNEEASSNDYVKEYKIPTACTQPLAITVDHNGMVWFAQTGTGKVAKFDPLTETFTEYANPVWEDIEKKFILNAVANNAVPEKLRSMMWGMDAFPDGSIWFTDERTDAIWKFSIDSESYDRISYTQIDEGKSLPQKLVIDGSKIIINDFTGGKLSFLDYAQDRQGLRHYAIPSVMEDAVTGDFAIDSDKNVWYTNWVPSGQGILVKFDYPGYESESSKGEVTQGLLLQDFIEWYNFSGIGLTTPNGVAVGPEQKIWIADTSSNYFFSFDPKTEEFTKYVTSIPTIDSYGNFGKNPVSNTYWIEHSDGNLIMNQHNANRIGVFNPYSETLVEYTVPSRNPNWADCEGIEYCGVAQVFDFAVDGKKIWFTEWVENNIGVVDTSILLPFSIDVNTNQITLEKGQTVEITLEADIIPNFTGTEINARVNSSVTSTFSDIVIKPTLTDFSLSDDPISIPVEITASEHALTGTHKVLLGAYTDDIAVSQFITVTIV